MSSSRGRCRTAPRSRPNGTGSNRAPGPGRARRLGELRPGIGGRARTRTEARGGRRSAAMTDARRRSGRSRCDFETSRKRIRTTGAVRAVVLDGLASCGSRCSSVRFSVALGLSRSVPGSTVGPGSLGGPVLGPGDPGGVVPAFGSRSCGRARRRSSGDPGGAARRPGCRRSAGSDRSGWTGRRLPEFRTDGRATAPRPASDESVFAPSRPDRGAVRRPVSAAKGTGSSKARPTGPRCGCRDGRSGPVGRPGPRARTCRWPGGSWAARPGATPGRCGRDRRGRLGGGRCRGPGGGRGGRRSWPGCGRRSSGRRIGRRSGCRRGSRAGCTRSGGTSRCSRGRATSAPRPGPSDAGGSSTSRGRSASSSGRSGRPTSPRTRRRPRSSR